MPYSTGPHPADPTVAYPTGQYPAGSAGPYPAGQYPAGSAGQYPAGSAGQYPADSAGPYPAGQYPAGSQPPYPPYPPYPGVSAESGPQSGFGGAGPYPPGYPQPGALPADHGGQPFAPVRPTNGLAVASLVLGIVGLVVCPGLASIPAVITGHIGRRQIRERNEDGAGFALAGLVTGWIGVAFAALIIGFFVVMFMIGTANS